MVERGERCFERDARPVGVFLFQFIESLCKYLSPCPVFEAANCDLKRLTLSGVDGDIKSEGNLFMLRWIYSLSLRWLAGGLANSWGGAWRGRPRALGFLLGVQETRVHR